MGIGRVEQRRQRLVKYIMHDNRWPEQGRRRAQAHKTLTRTGLSPVGNEATNIRCLNRVC